MKFPRNARIFRGQLDASPFVGVLFLVVLFLLLNSSLVFIPGVPISLPEAVDLPGVAGATLTVAVDKNGTFYFRNQVIPENRLQQELRRAAQATGQPLTLVLLADKNVPFDTIFHLARLAHGAGLKDVWFAGRSPGAPVRAGGVR